MIQNIMICLCILHTGSGYPTLLLAGKLYIYIRTMRKLQHDSTPNVGHWSSKNGLLPEVAMGLLRSGAPKTWHPKALEGFGFFAQSTCFFSQHLNLRHSRFSAGLFAGSLRRPVGIHAIYHYCICPSYQ